MSGVAFVGVLGGHSVVIRKKNCAFSQGRPRHYGTLRRFRLIANGNLYPNVEPPEPIENPVTSNSATPSPASPNSDIPVPATPIPATPDPVYPDEDEAANESPKSFIESGKSLLEKLNDRLRNRVKNTDVAATAQGSSVSTTETEFPVSNIPNGSLDYASASKALWRLGWATWWVQLILTVISAVILLFSFAFPGVNIRTSASAAGFILSGAGVFVAFVSLFWTYSYTRLSLWLEGSPDRTIEKARGRIIGKLRVGLLLAIVGLLVSLTGLQAIVGTLLARLLSAGIATVPFQTGTPPPGIVQPVDVLVVQASANAMMALMASLTTTIWLRARSKKWQKIASS